MTGRLHSIYASVTGHLPGRLAFTGYGRTSHKLALATGEAAWLLTICFNEIPPGRLPSLCRKDCSVHVVVDGLSTARIIDICLVFKEF